MKKILFVCLGNICRSPAAEGIMRQKLQNEGLVEGKDFVVDSAGTGGYWNGSPPDERSQQICQEHNLDISKQISRALKPADGKEFDYIYCMDESNLQASKSIISSEYHDKIQLINTDGIGDPYRLRLDGFKKMYSELDEATAEIMHMIVG